MDKNNDPWTPPEFEPYDFSEWVPLVVGFFIVGFIVGSTLVVVLITGHN